LLFNKVDKSLIAKPINLLLDYNTLGVVMIHIKQLYRLIPGHMPAHDDIHKIQYQKTNNPNNPNRRDARVTEITSQLPPTRQNQGFRNRSIKCLNNTYNYCKPYLLYTTIQLGIGLCCFGLGLALGLKKQQSMDFTLLFSVLCQIVRIEAYLNINQVFYVKCVMILTYVIVTSHFLSNGLADLLSELNIMKDVRDYKVLSKAKNLVETLLIPDVITLPNYNNSAGVLPP